MKVLIVDGEKQKRRAIVDALTCLEQIAVVGAVPDLEAASEALLRQVADAVIIDVRLADGQAIESIASSLQATTPWIVVIGDTLTREEWRSLLLAGADHVVERDAALRELQQVIKDLIVRSGARDATPPAEARAR